VGLLREGDPAQLGVETLDGIALLTAQVSATGRAVELVTVAADDRGSGHGDVADAVPLGTGLGPLAQLTAYRIVQESLANAVQHAPGAACRVTIDDRDPEVVVVTVHNDAGSTAPPTARADRGFGLAGMRERAALTAAELHYGPTIDGGWDVSLRLRRDTTASETNA
jgi:signal transduction histidine kinase